MTDFERAQRTGAHTLMNSGPVFSPTMASPSLDLESEAQAYILGGSSSSSTLVDTREERRCKALEAAVNRLRREEEELEYSCGTTGSNQLDI